MKLNDYPCRSCFLHSAAPVRSTLLIHFTLQCQFEEGDWRGAKVRVSAHYATDLYEQICQSLLEALPTVAQLPVSILDLLVLKWKREGALPTAGYKLQ